MTPDIVLLRPAESPSSQNDPGLRRASDSGNEFERTLKKASARDAQADKKSSRTDQKDVAQAQNKNESDVTHAEKSSAADTEASTDEAQSDTFTDAVEAGNIVQVSIAPNPSAQSDGLAGTPVVMDKEQAGLTPPVVAGRDELSLQAKMVGPDNAEAGTATHRTGTSGQNGGRSLSESLVTALQGRDPGAGISAAGKEGAGGGARETSQILGVLTAAGPGSDTLTPASAPVQGAGALAPSRDAPTGPYVTQLMQPAGSERWQHELGEKMTWMIHQNVHKAQVHLNPADLGPIDIQIHVSKDQAHIQMHATQVMTRDMLDAAAWRLREALAGQGLNLSGFDVSDQPAYQDRSGHEPANSSGEAGMRADDTVAQETEPSTVVQALMPGRVDTYV